MGMYTEGYTAINNTVYLYMCVHAHTKYIYYVGIYTNHSHTPTFFTYSPYLHVVYIYIYI